MATVLSNTPALSRTLAQAGRRVRLSLALQRGATGLGAGALVSGIALALLRLRVLDDDSLPAEALLLPPLFGLAAGVVHAFLVRLTPLDLARLTEQRLDLKERFSTALAFSSTATDDPLVRRQILDAEAHAARGSLDLPGAIPLRPSRRVWAACALTLIVGLAWFLPTLPLFMSAQQRAEREVVKKEGERIVRVAKAAEQRAAQKKLPQAQAAAKKLTALGEQMKRGQLTKQKALMKAAKLTEQMKAQQQAAANQNGGKSLAQAGKEMQKALAATQAAPKGEGGDKNNRLNAAAAANNQQAKGANGKKATPAREAMRSAAQAMANEDAPSLAEQLSKLAQMAEQGQPGDKPNRDQLADQLSTLSNSLRGTALEKASEPLQKAAEAMKKGDLNEAARQLQEAARRVNEAQKGREDAKSLQQMAEALQAGQGQQQSADGSQEGDVPEDTGEGAGKDDAFGKNGKTKKGHVHTAQCLKPGGT